MYEAILKVQTLARPSIIDVLITLYHWSEFDCDLTLYASLLSRLIETATALRLPIVLAISMHLSCI
jgi:hypothetical protein